MCAYVCELVNVFSDMCTFQCVRVFSVYNRKKKKEENGEANEKIESIFEKVVV